MSRQSIVASLIVALCGCFLISCYSKKVIHQNERLEAKSSLLGIKMFADIRGEKCLGETEGSEIGSSIATKDYRVLPGIDGFNLIGNIPLEETKASFLLNPRRLNYVLVPDILVTTINNRIHRIELNTIFPNQLSAVLREAYGEPDSTSQKEENLEQEFWISKKLTLRADYKQNGYGINHMKLSLESTYYKPFIRRYEDSAEIVQRKEAAREL